MIDWWQALLIALGTSIVTGGFAVLAGYAQWRWSKQGAKESDERQAAAREAEEVRRARREHRKERVDPIYSLLTLVREDVARSAIEASTTNIYEANLGGVADQMSKDQFVMASTENLPKGSAIAVVYALHNAMAVPVSAEVNAAIGEVMVAISPSGPAKNEFAPPSQALRRLEQALENYIVGGIPAKE